MLIKSYTTKKGSFTKPTENTVKLNLKGSGDTEDVKGLNFKTINAPLTGIFYTSPSPEGKPFVNLNEKISKNSNLCIIEAMKVMNTIKAPYDCTLIEILVNNEELVECGQPLFKVSV
ncbi:acetyl-CoA carboxylase, biotin carboxyl carrier protein [Candidatus Pinguicoccus supinus]|uniref:Biotin carboxyl carrier protein of acetyl-CoA carboxylase n=1 Tax=Candidatus Pinguicoccus supinus TaxID=2529394 RepID=A0A7T0FXT2_9BACT|nr:acetyl-CoA carboxylase, biotin carboxyl carrier protein [Candidatus Pinguicoccus supinus]